MNDTSLRTSFDQASAEYAEVRPSYPGEIIEAMVSLSQISSGGRILEVGVGTGQITLPLAKRGYAITGLELGPALAERARENLKPYPKVQVVTTTFEGWEGLEKFDLLVSAQAFHWIQTEVGLAKALEHLNGSGAIALVWTLDESNTAFQEASTPTYQKYVPEQPGRPTPKEGHQRYRSGLLSHPGFEQISERAVRWNQHYTKEDYLKLHDTYSNQRALSESVRSSFKHELSNLIDQYVGAVERHYRTVLLVARRSP